jgi:hypothetical protein
LSQEAKEHKDTLARWTFFMLNAEEARALFEKLSASERESEVHGSNENSHTIKIDPLTGKFQGMALTQPVASDTHQAEQEIVARCFLVSRWNTWKHTNVGKLLELWGARVIYRVIQITHTTITTNKRGQVIVTMHASKLKTRQE